MMAAFWLVEPLAVAFSFSISARVRLAPKAPMRRKSRRLMPSQKRRLLPHKVSICAIPPSVVRETEVRSVPAVESCRTRYLLVFGRVKALAGQAQDQTGSVQAVEREYTSDVL